MHDYILMIMKENNEKIPNPKEIEKEIGAAKNKTEKGKVVGKLIAKKASEKGINSVVFDRSGYRYHGRVQAIAEGAREGGLKF